MRDIVDRLKGLGVTRPEWKECPYLYFSHSGGRAHMEEVGPFFNSAVALAREAAAEIERLRKLVGEEK